MFSSAFTFILIDLALGELCIDAPITRLIDKLPTTPSSRKTLASRSSEISERGTLPGRPVASHRQEQLRRFVGQELQMFHMYNRDNAAIARDPD